MSSQIQLVPLSLPQSASTEHLSYFGREVVGLNPNSELSPDEFKQIEHALYTHDLLVFRNVDLSPEAQVRLAKAFDPTATTYSLGNKPQSSKSILSAYIKQRLPNFPQIQVIGHGTIYNHEGIDAVTLKHGRHPELHHTSLTPEEESDGFTRFFRWHMDAAMYEYDVPKVTLLYGIKIPTGPKQTVRYDDGSGDELQVPLGTTAMVSGKVMFDILPDELKSLAVRARVTYAPHPFDWLSEAKAFSNGLGVVSEGKELPLDKLPPWEESKVKIYPMVWKNPVTGNLHLQVHPLFVNQIAVDPLPRDTPNRDAALYPDGITLTNLNEIRELLYKLQRPGIAPSLVYPHEWKEKDLIIFHNRGIMHSVVGVFEEDGIRLLHQCNLASPTPPQGPTEDDVKKWSVDTNGPIKTMYE